MRKSILGPKIEALRLQGFSYIDIQNTLNCSKGTISYHLGKGQKEKTKLRRKNVLHSTYIHVKRVNCFHNRKPRTQRKLKPTTSYTHRQMSKAISAKASKFQKNAAFNYKDVHAKYGDHFQCALTGRPLSWNKPQEYEYDHILPVARGGTSCLDNLQIVCTDANRAKNDLTEEEFLDLCKEVVLHAGYKVWKPSGSYHSNKYL
jgi:5-methylcytosine-specific restriction endonuclease McrA